MIAVAPEVGVVRRTCGCDDPLSVREVAGARFACATCGAPCVYRRRVEAPRRREIDTSRTCSTCGCHVAGSLCVSCGHSPGRRD